MSLENSEKKKALESALGKIEKKFWKFSVIKIVYFTEKNVESIKTGY